MENVVRSISLPRAVDEKVKAFARKQGQTRSRLIHEALLNYLQRKEIVAIEQKMQARARSMGIETDEDVVSLIHEVREVRKKARR